MEHSIVSIFGRGDYDAQIRRGAGALQAGGLVVLPTETVYGAAGLLTHHQARQRLLDMRGGDAHRPFIIHLAAAGDALNYLDPVNDYAQRLMRKLWPGPVSLLFDVSASRRAAVARELGLAEDDLYDTTGITLRCPEHIVATDILRQVKGPVAMTACPTPGRTSDWSINELAEGLSQKVDLIFDAGPTKYSKPSTILKVLDDRFEILRAGVYDERIIERLLRTTILFVCSGNTCRSPMAEAIARQVLAKQLSVPVSELDKRGITVLSAGSYALPGARATPQAVVAVKDLGADLTQHRSRPLTVELINQADLILTMSHNHAQQVMSLVPSAGDKVQTLDPNGDIEDPIGGDVALYQSLAIELERLIDKRLRDASLSQTPLL